MSEGPDSSQLRDGVLGESAEVIRLKNSSEETLFVRPTSLHRNGGQDGSQLLRRNLVEGPGTEVAHDVGGLRGHAVRQRFDSTVGQRVVLDQ